jgi:hypothetical protein
MGPELRVSWRYIHQKLAIDRRGEFEGEHGEHGFRGWRATAFGGFGHGMPGPYGRKLRENDMVMGGKYWELWRVFAVGQAEAYATERQLRWVEVSGTKNEGDRTMW